MRSFTRLPVFVSLFALIPLTSLAQQVRYAGSLLWNQCNDVEVVTPTAYCVFENGLMILDVSDPDTVFAYSRVFCQGEGRKVDIAENYAFLADGTAGLQIIDISSKEHPQLVGQCDTPGEASDIAIYGDYAFVADDREGLQVIDISSLSNPVLVNSISMPDSLPIGEIVIEGNYAYIGGHRMDGYLYIYDVSDPVQPNLMASLYIVPPSPQGHGIVGINIVGSYAYIGASGSRDGIYLVDISDPTSPFIQQYFHVYDSIRDVSVVGDHVFALCEYELEAYCMDDSIGFKFIGRYRVRRESYYTHSLFVADGQAYIAAQNALEIVDVSNPDSLRFSGTYQAGPLPSYYDNLAVSGDYAYMSKSRGLQIIDVSNPYEPAPIDSCILPGSPRRVKAAGDYVYTSINYLGMQVVNVSDPHNPFIAGTYLPQSTSADVAAVQGSYAYLSTGLGLEIVDISDPPNPTLAGQYWRLGTVAVSGSYAYIGVTPSSEFQVVNIENPANPTLVGSMPLEAVRTIAIQGNYAYVLNSQEFIAIDISNPSAPVLAGSCPTTRVTRDLRVVGNYAYLSVMNLTYVTGGIEVVDISDPYNPTMIYDYHLPGYSYAIEYADGFCYLVTEYSIVVFQTTTTAIGESPEQPSVFSLSQNYPNPFNARTTIRYTLARPGPVRLEVFNLLGERMAILINSFQAAGEHTLIWDADEFPTGVFFARLHAGDKIETIKMVVLK